MVRVLLFDIDGTLLTTAGVGNQALTSALERQFGIQAPDTNICFSGRTDRSLITELLQRNKLPSNDQNCDLLRQRYIELFPAELSRLGGRCLPGVMELLPRLSSDSRVDLAVMTGNFPETATWKLEHFGLHKHIRWLVGGDLHVNRDDLARWAAQKIRDRYGDRVSQTVVIGDTPADVRCGKAINAQTVAVSTGVHSADALRSASPCVLFDDLSDTERVVECLVGDAQAS